MGKKQKPCDCPRCLPGWLQTFGDLMSLLLTFFVLLLSMATFDKKKIQEAIGSLSGALSVLEGGIKTEVSVKRVQQATPIEDTDETDDVVNQLSRTVIEYNEMTNSADGPVISLEESEEGFIIRLPANLLFEPGSAKITNEDATLFIKRITMIIKQLPPDIHVVARGHTDNDQLESVNFVDNWELSAERGLSVVRELLKAGLDGKKISAAGYGEYEPITTNNTPEGRAKNRRVDLHFFSQNQGSKNQAMQSVLDATAPTTAPQE